MSNRVTGDLSTFGAACGEAAALLRRAGVREDEAALTATAIVLAELWGIPSHGLMRLPYYLARLQAGGIRADAQLTTVRDTGPIVAYDGGCGLGHWQSWRAAEIAVERCAQYGLAAVSVADSSHCGSLGVYTLPIVAAGQIALVFSNGPAVMPPWGGDTPLLSTSPIAAGIPCRPRPAIVDMATSAVARGKIAQAAKRGEPLAEGWALDAHGSPTIDPQAALAGMLAPLGGPKGFALALVVEALTGAAVGPALSTEVSDMFDPGVVAVPQRISHLVLAIDPGRIDGDGNGQARLDRLAERVESSGGRLPGARRRAPRDIAPDEPLAVAEQTVSELAEWRVRLERGRVPDT